MSDCDGLSKGQRDADKPCEIYDCSELEEVKEPRQAAELKSSSLGLPPPICRSSKPILKPESSPVKPQEELSSTVQSSKHQTGSFQANPVPSIQHLRGVPANSPFAPKPSPKFSSQSGPFPEKPSVVLRSPASNLQNGSMPVLPAVFHGGRPSASPLPSATINDAKLLTPVVAGGVPEENYVCCDQNLLVENTPKPENAVDIDVVPVRDRLPAEEEKAVRDSATISKPTVFTKPAAPSGKLRLDHLHAAAAKIVTGIPKLLKPRIPSVASDPSSALYEEPTVSAAQVSPPPLPSASVPTQRVHEEQEEKNLMYGSADEGDSSDLRSNLEGGLRLGLSTGIAPDQSLEGNDDTHEIYEDPDQQAPKKKLPMRGERILNKTFDQMKKLFKQGKGSSTVEESCDSAISRGSEPALSSRQSQSSLTEPKRSRSAPSSMPAPKQPDCRRTATLPKGHQPQSINCPVPGGEPKTLLSDSYVQELPNPSNSGPSLSSAGEPNVINANVDSDKAMPTTKGPALQPSPGPNKPQTGRDKDAPPVPSKAPSRNPSQEKKAPVPPPPGERVPQTKPVSSVESTLPARESDADPVISIQTLRQSQVLDREEFLPVSPGIGSKPIMACPKPPLPLPSIPKAGDVSSSGRVTTSSIGGKPPGVAAGTDKNIAPICPPLTGDKTVVQLANGLSEFSWYRGNFTRQQAEDHLRAIAKDGAFVIRNTDKGAGYSISIWASGDYTHLRIPLSESTQTYSLGTAEVKFASVEDLVKHYKSNSVKLKSNLTIQLKDA